MQEGPIDSSLLPHEPVRLYDGRYAGVVLVSTDGRCILQERTSGDGVKAPGMISLFGGGQQRGEHPVLCVVRELYEELALEVDPDRLRLLGYIDKREANGAITRCTIFELRGVAVSQLQLHEGKGIVVETADILLANGRVTGVAKASIRAALQSS